MIPELVPILGSQPEAVNPIAITLPLLSYLTAHNFGKMLTDILNFIHRRTQQRSCNEMIIQDPITP